MQLKPQPSVETQGPHLAAQTPVSKSVLFDMIPALFPVGVLVIQSKNSETSTEMEKVEYIVPVLQYYTIQQYIDLFVANGMQRYRFDSTGSGCMYWVASVFGLLGESGWAPPGHFTGIIEFHKQHAEARPLDFALPLRKGDFY